ncbi:MAG: PTS galactosamine/N-acetylgalactosamine transporter subunit IIA [Angelakisella sp.]
MVGIIVTGHANFATGITSALHLISGAVENYVTVDFLEGDSTQDLEQKLKAAIKSLKHCDGILMLCDLVGGSPFKTSVRLSVDQPIQVIGGANLPMLVEVAMTVQNVQEINLNDLCDLALDIGQMGMQKFQLKDTSDEDMDQL